jgi:hypothetical protein
MAHFAEIDSNNKVIRVVVACNQDITNNGGELSEQAAKHFETVIPLSSLGIKWIQTSYNNNFRNKYAGIGDTYDFIKDKFISPQPYPSWSLDQNGKWQAPKQMPEPTYTGTGKPHFYAWNEELYDWIVIP